MQSLNPDEFSISESFLDFKDENIFITDSSLENDDISELNILPRFWSPSISIDSNNTILKQKRKRGRKNNKEEPQHTEFKNDNKMSKIQVSYFSFLIEFINSIMKLLNLNYYFIELNGKDKSKINQKYRDCLNKKTIKEIILETPISGRFKKDQNFNAIQYDKLVKDGQSIIIDIMNKKFLFFFNIYFNNVKKINLSSFGLKSLEVELPDSVKFFNDLLKKRKCGDFERYKKEMEKCAKNNFISNIKNSLNESINEN